MKIYFALHGQSETNKEKTMAGRTKNTVLSEKGKEQAIELGNKLKDKKIDIIFTSPLKRARETTDLINSVRDKEIPVVVSEDLLEVDYGVYEGVRKNNFDYNSFWDYSNKDRVNEFFLFAWPIIRFIYCDLTRYYQDKSVLVVAHGGVAKIFELILGEFSLLPENVGPYLPDRSDYIEYNDEKSEFSFYFSNSKSKPQKRKINRKLFAIITPNIIGKAVNDMKKNLGKEFLDFKMDKKPKIRNRLGIIVVNDEGKIAIRKYSNTGEVKLIGGDINYVAGLNKSIEHLVYDHSGFLCDYKNHKKIGNTIEIRPGDPLADITITEIVAVKLVKEIGEPDPPLKQVKEGFSFEWLDIEDAYNQIKESLNTVHPYEALKGTDDYRPLLTKQSIVYRDRVIMEYFIEHKEKFI